MTKKEKVPCVLIRDGENLYGEKEILQKLNFPFQEVRTKIPKNSLVIGRYSVLPFYRELEEDLATRNSKLINSYSQFRYCADLANWYRDLHSVTPITWFTLQEYLNDCYEGPVVLKGETNSRRDKWSTHMFARNKDEAREVYCRLLDDSLISQQQIYIRAYAPLKKLIDGVGDMPIPNEWRVFVLYGTIISCSYYWSSYLEDIKEKNIYFDIPPSYFTKDVIARIGNNSNFYSFDVAQTEHDSWTLIEVNEGQMSGLNGVDPELFYSRMQTILACGH